MEKVFSNRPITRNRLSILNMETNIYTKLLQFQKLNISIKKGSQNPHFKNRYADINEVLEKVKGSLNEMGIVLIQKPQQLTGMETVRDGFGYGLVTELFDIESKTSVTSFTPFINTTDMQKLGGAITYARRYSLIAMLGLEDEDDDGNKASEKQPLPKEDEINFD